VAVAAAWVGVEALVALRVLPEPLVVLPEVLVVPVVLVRQGPRVLRAPLVTPRVAPCRPPRWV
jgi:hypothetical protein